MVRATELREIFCRYENHQALESRAMNLRVLIADADTVLLSAYRAYLIEGIDTYTVTSGLDCLDQLRRWQPDILVLNADLPWGSGLGVLEVMQEDPAIPIVPVLLLTERPAALAEQTIPVRDYALLIKPVSPFVLASVIFTLADSGWGDRPKRSSVSGPPAPAMRPDGRRVMRGRESEDVRVREQHSH